MIKYFITGKVLPERTNFFLSPLIISFSYPTPEGHLDLQIAININLSQVSMVVTSEQLIDDYYTLRNYLQLVLDQTLDVYGYLKGIGYSSEITSLVTEDGGVQIIFGVGVETLTDKEDERPFDYNKIVLEILNLNSDNKTQNQLRISLHNFRMAILYPHDTAFYCYRAVESIRKIFDKNEKVDNWDLMHNELGTEKEWLMSLAKDHASQQRHGGTTQMSAQEREDMLKNTQKTIDKLLVYLSENVKIPTENVGIG